MCLLLGEEIKGGESKKSQIREWRRYFNFKNNGQKYTITQIYDEPLPKCDERNKGNNSIYISYIELILMYQLIKHDNKTIVMTRPKICELIGLTNKKYFHATEKNILDNNEIVTTFDIKNFKFRTNQKLKDIFFGALRNLKNRSLILYKEHIMIIQDIIDEHGSIIEYNNKRVANEEEERIILATKYEVIQSMGLTYISQAYLRFRDKEFHSKINKLLYERYGWKMFYNFYEIIYTRENIIDSIPKVEYEINKKALNDTFIVKINEQAKNKYNKNQEEQIENFNKLFEVEVDDSLTKVPEKKFSYSPIYVEAQIMLTEYLLRI